tara:strand:+ start:1931 stop:2266 length:336 start_codon:yes stop_codon:yes gene_type:complete
MLIWKGNGFLAIIIPVMIFIPVLMIFSVIGGSDPTENIAGIGISISLALSSFATWKIGKRLNGGDGKLLIDPDTGEKVLLKSEHSFWFINLEYWGVLWGILAIVALIAEFR